MIDEDHLRDLFAGLPRLTTRRMFGGLAIYSDGSIFALEAFDQLWIKADVETTASFEKAGSRQFVYEGGGKSVKLPYWSLPDEALDDPDNASRWARLGLEATLRAPRKAPRKRQSKTP